MNIYLCSTVRHLLFSLLKAQSDTNEKQVIFMIVEQQNIDPNEFDKTALPPHVEVYFVQRDVIRKSMYKGIKGKVLKICAEFNIQLSESKQRNIALKLFNQELGLNFSENDLNSANLFLFNERNKFSRLFRLAFSNFYLLEEGAANYIGKAHKKIKKILLRIVGSSSEQRYFGDDKRCLAIYLLFPEKSPASIKSKVKKINFIDNENNINICKQFFKLKLEKGLPVILATQPSNSPELDMEIYQKIIELSKKQNLKVVIKPHPREDIKRYQTAFPDLTILNNKVPLELLIFGLQTKTNIISIFSTAGLGFEEYCNRLNIINDSILTHDTIRELFDEWEKKPKVVINKIKKLLEKI